jgi:rubrerythrin
MLMADLIDNEILEMAVVREVDSNRFYLALAARAEDSHIKKIFEKLAAEELEHKAIIELEIMKTGRVINEHETLAVFRDEQPDYVPPKMKKNYKDIMLMGLQKEEASIQLYTDLAGMTTDAGSREIFLALAHEEAGHKERFQKALDFLSHIT